MQRELRYIVRPLDKTFGIYEAECYADKPPKLGKLVTTCDSENGAYHKISELPKLIQPVE